MNIDNKEFLAVKASDITKEIPRPKYISVGRHDCDEENWELKRQYDLRKGKKVNYISGNSIKCCPRCLRDLKGKETQ